MTKELLVGHLESELHLPVISDFDFEITVADFLLLRIAEGDKELQLFRLAMRFAVLRRRRYRRSCWQLHFAAYLFVCHHFLLFG